MKKVLIITYYWPPAGGGGVMRWVKMSRYLKENTDWEPIIFTAKDAGYLVTDDSLGNSTIESLKTIRHGIIEPNNFLNFFGLNKLKNKVASGGVGQGKSKSGNWKERLAVWVRSNMFIPDARSLWIRPASRRIIRELKDLHVDAIITTGPPHSLHLIGLNVKKKLGIPWVADFRDPWTSIDFFDDLKLTKRSRKKHFNLEETVVKGADELVTISQDIANQFYDMYQRKFHVITNGFDPADFASLEPHKESTYFTISHVGSLNKDRNLPVFWQSVKALCDRNEAFAEKIQVNLIGTVTGELQEELTALGIADKVNIIKHLPHKEAIKRTSASELLLLLINNTPNQKGIMPGKFFEYMATGRPILCIGNKEGDIAKVIKETKAGVVISYDDQERLEKILIEHFELYLNNGIPANTSKEIHRYSRKSLAIDYSKLLNTIIPDTN